MNDAFETWWNNVELPRIQNSAGAFIFMKHIDDIKAEMLSCWTAAWNAEQIKKLGS